MPRRKQLKGVALGLLGTFVSRNNDIFGYWGIGVLRLVADSNKISKLILDLAEKLPHEEIKSPVQIAEDMYRKWLFSRLANEGIDYRSLEKMEIHLRFSNFDELPGAIRDTGGEPYVCKVVLKAKGGVKCVVSKTGVCAGHDPSKDRQSNRVQ